MAHDLWRHNFLWLKPTKKDSAVLSIKWKRITDKKEMVLWGTTLLLIVLITVNTVLNTTYLNWDDETGCANSVGAWYTDLVNRTAPESGELKKAFYDKKYVIAGWSIFSSMLAVLTDIHPAVINRMLLPMIKIPLTYSIFYQMINNLFMQQTKNASQRNHHTSTYTSDGRTFCRNKQRMGVLFVVCFACCSIAASLLVTAPITLALWGGLYLIWTKRWRKIINVCVRVIPAAACALIG